MHFDGPLPNGVVVVSSDAESREQLCRMFLQIPGFSGPLSEASSVTEALKLHAHDVKPCYILEGGREGEDLRRSLSDPTLMVIVIVPEAQFEWSARLMAGGIQDCLIRSEVTPPSLWRAILKSQARLRGQHSLLAADLAGRELRAHVRFLIHELKQPLQAAGFGLHNLSRTLPPGNIPAEEMISGLIKDVTHISNLINKLSDRV